MCPVACNFLTILLFNLNKYHIFNEFVSFSFAAKYLFQRMDSTNGENILKLWVVLTITTRRGALDNKYNALERGYWMQIQKENCLADNRIKATKNFVLVLEDVHFSVRMDQVEVSFKMLYFLYVRFASTCTFPLFAVFHLFWNALQ